MENIPSSFLGYNKKAVLEIISKKNKQLKTQQEDISYLRTENTELKRKLKSKNKPSKVKAPEPEA